MTQTDAVLYYLHERRAEGLTALEALELVGTMRLAARIADLRADGHDIRTEIVTTSTGKRVARYVLVERRWVTWDEMRQQIGAK